ncbi:hypothetical protein ACVIU7_005803 [Bradyrhizobium liaoningense]
MPCSPGSRVRSGLPSLLRNSPAPRRLTRLPPPQELDRSNDGQDHTVLPYARPAMSPQFSQPCRRSWKLTGETKPSSAARPHAASGSRRAIRPALHLSCTTLPRPPQAQLATMTTTRSPLKDEPGWATHTINPNFGKVEYFRADGLTGERNTELPASCQGAAKRRARNPFNHLYCGPMDSGLDAAHRPGMTGELHPLRGTGVPSAMVVTPFRSTIIP